MGVRASPLANRPIIHLRQGMFCAMPPFAVFVLDFIVPFLSQIGTFRKNFSKKGLNYACFFPYVVESIFPNFEIRPSNDGIFCPFIIEDKKVLEKLVVILSKFSVCNRR